MCFAQLIQVIWTRLRIREWINVVSVLRRLVGRMGWHVCLQVFMFPSGDTRRVGVVYFGVWLGCYPLRHDRIDDMHVAVEPTSIVTLHRIAPVKEAYMAHIAILTTTGSSTAAWVAMHHMFKDEFDVIWNRAVVQDTIGPTFGAVSFQLILVAQFSLLSDPNAVGTPIFGRRWW